jgi:hypothetical protein
MSERIIFRYVGCELADFQNEASFDEEVFRTTLEKAFQMNIHIDRIEVTFHHDPEQIAPYTTIVDMVAPGIDHNKVTQQGKDIAGTTRTAIDTAIQILRKYKDRHTH